jgi:non-ribosomal peptide synthetase component F
VTLLRAMVTDASQPVPRADLLSAAERELLLETWNATETAYPRERCIHQLFEEQVRQRSEAIAVVQQHVGLTYSELNARANRVARRLIALGVRRGDCVAILLERSAMLVVAELAILKAGGIYVPLDVQAPAARQAWMAAEAARSW